ncbi:MAG: clostripain-related cysteine peptidase [Clostridium sp.]|nr:clostripain-related cysteine peptidase [Clostridium sp.]
MARKFLIALGALLRVLLILFLIGIFLPDEETAVVENTEILNAQLAYSEGDTWALYWYLCGSDLESLNSAASRDLEELTAAPAGENVTVVIQTGGARQWEYPGVSADVSQRFVYDPEGLRLVQENAPQNMGEAQTLADFLSFCTENYPADHTALILWNHGGGTIGGVAYDEQFDFDSLSLDELSWALENVFGAGSPSPPLELAGFDACLMASIDTAASLRGYAKYMVASQEMEPALGWNYTGLMSALAHNPGITGAQLGKHICDSFASACQEEGAAQDITLSVIDLEHLDALITAYHNAGVETLAGACASPSFLSSFSRGARAAEHYGGNTKEDGYSNMVDLGDLIRSNASLLPQSAQEVLDALEACVVYKINGPYRAQSSGLSCYHPYDGDIENLEAFSQVAVGTPYIYLYEYAITGALSKEGLSYAGYMEFESLPGDGDFQQSYPEIRAVTEVTDMETVDTLELEDFPVYVTDDCYAVLDLGPETASHLSGVYIQLTYVDYEEDVILFLGRDNDLDSNWEEGVFMDNFRGVWGAVDGCFVYMELIYEGMDYNLYTVPALLNGEEYNLRVSYDYGSETYSILGARKGIDNYGMSDKNLVMLQPGDSLTTLHYGMSISGDDLEPELVPVDTILINKETRFHQKDMGDGEFIFLFEMEDTSGNYALSEMVRITVDRGDIFLEEF